MHAALDEDCKTATEIKAEVIDPPKRLISDRVFCEHKKRGGNMRQGRHKKLNAVTPEAEKREGGNPPSTPRN